MIEIINKDILDFEEKVMICQVNYDNSISSEFSREVMTKFPEVHDYYEEWRKLYKSEVLPGKIQMVPIFRKNKPLRYVTNMFTQYYDKNNEKTCTDYEAFKSAVKRLSWHTQYWRQTIAISPKIACNKDDWQNIRQIIVYTFRGYEDNIKIYK